MGLISHILTSWGTYKPTKGCRIWVTSKALLLVSGRAIVTVLPLRLEDLATVLVYQITGEWVRTIGAERAARRTP